MLPSWKPRPQSIDSDISQVLPPSSEIRIAEDQLRSSWSGRRIAPLFNTPSQLLLLGGIEVGQNTLLRFYVLHVILMPLIAALFLAVHFWRIRKDGGISGPL